VRSLLSAGLNKLKTNVEGIDVTGHRQGRVLAIAAQKGGVGKTTTAVNLACSLARGGKLKVLVIDIDPQGHVASSIRDSVYPSRTTLSQILLAEQTRDLMDCVVNTGIENVFITAQDKQLSETDILLSTRMGREYLLQGALLNARSHFDVIIIDCPPNVGNLTVNAMVAADQVLVPCDMSILAFEGVADLLAAVNTVNLRLRQSLDVLGILRTRVDGRTRQINDAIGSALEENYGDLLLETMIPINSALAKAQAAGLSIYQFQARSRGAQAYDALADEVVSRMGRLERAVLAS
jgi:chromosome partitioning protein